MALIGSWGQFIAIPKCAGEAMREYLKYKYVEAGYEENGKHDLPNTITNAFAIVRHPVYWLLSFYAYYSQHDWQWTSLPQYIDDQFSFATNTSWAEYAASVTTVNPGAVGKVFDYYCVPGVKVYKMEELADHFPRFFRKHVTMNKPTMSPRHWRMICDAEQETLKHYGYESTQYSGGE